MLRAVITFCLNYRLVVLLLAVGMLVAGVIVALHSPWDVFPEFAPPQIVVQTEAPGLSTEEVEQLVTVPIESAINGVSGLDTLRSSSVPGLSVITATFEEGTDVLNARQMVNERLVEAKRLLPEIAEAPQLTPLKTSVSRLATIGLTSDTVSPRDLRTLADWTLRRRLLAVRGVAQVEIFGGEVKQYQVLTDPERLWQYNVTLAEVIAAAQSATGFGGAGYVETLSQRLPVRQRTRIETTEDLAAAPVAYRNGASLTLGKVADVQIGSADRHGDSTINGKSGVMLVVHKQPNVDTLAVTEELEGALDELQVALPKNVTLHRATLSPSNVHRASDAKSNYVDPNRLLARDAHPHRIPVPMANCRHQFNSNTTFTFGSGFASAMVRRVAECNDLGRIGNCAWSRR